MWRAGWSGLALAIALVGGGCNRDQGGQGTQPGANAGTTVSQQVQQSQKAAEDALEQARQAQKNASRMQSKADDAQKDVEDAKRKLSEAEQQAKQARQKAAQAQQDAQQKTQQAQASAQEAQRRALHGQRMQDQQSPADRGTGTSAGQPEDSSAVTDGGPRASEPAPPQRP